MSSAVEADLAQLGLMFSLHRRLVAVIDPSEIQREIGDRLREELDYAREAKVAALYGRMLSDLKEIRVPRVFVELSTRRLLTLEWLDGENLIAFESASSEVRARVTAMLFRAWWRPFLSYGVIHGDPHLGNYSVVAEGEALNLYDYGCVRIFPPSFVGGLVDLYRGMLAGDSLRVAHAYEQWGFQRLTRQTIEAMNIWARFICGPILDNRSRTVADGVKPSEYGRREIGAVMRALRAEGGDLTVPSEFPLMERAAIGLGAAFLRLRAELNFHALFEELLVGFEVDAVAERQRQALAAAGL